MKINDIGMPFTSNAGDRQYSASDFREYFDKLLDGGIVGDVGNELEVKAQAEANKSVYVDTGAVFIKGAMRIVETTTTLAISENISGNARIDRIVARVNYSDRKIEFVVLEGTPAASPIAPALARGSSAWELSLAQVFVSDGFNSIAEGDITDERSDETLCGYFRYRAKPAWYPGGDVPMDAYMYLLFKEELSVSEISDIEGNATLMAIINAANILSKNNTTAFTPTEDYHPVPKKYLDDHTGNAKIASGSYIGDGEASKDISLDFPPKFVYISGYINKQYSFIGLIGTQCLYFSTGYAAGYSSSYLTCGINKFTVSELPNTSGKTFFYVAIG